MFGLILWTLISIFSPNLVSCQTCERSQLVLPNNSYILYIRLESFAILECLPGYKFSTETEGSVLCQKGKWQENSDIQCEPVDCGQPVPPHNGFCMYSSTTFGAKVTCSCDTGYNFSGNAQRTCNSNAEWSGQVPECVPEGIFSDDPTIWPFTEVLSESMEDSTTAQLITKTTQLPPSINTDSTTHTTKIIHKSTKRKTTQSPKSTTPLLSTHSTQSTQFKTSTTKLPSSAKSTANFISTKIFTTFKPSTKSLPTATKSTTTTTQASTTFTTASTTTSTTSTTLRTRSNFVQTPTRSTSQSVYEITKPTLHRTSTRKYIDQDPDVNEEKSKPETKVPKNGVPPSNSMEDLNESNMNTDGAAMDSTASDPVVSTLVKVVLPIGLIILMLFLVGIILMMIAMKKKKEKKRPVHRKPSDSCGIVSERSSGYSSNGISPNHSDNNTDSVYLSRDSQTTSMMQDNSRKSFYIGLTEDACSDNSNENAYYNFEGPHWQDMHSQISGSRNNMNVDTVHYSNHEVQHDQAYLSPQDNYSHHIPSTLPNSLYSIKENDGVTYMNTPRSYVEHGTRMNLSNNGIHTMIM